ncbi:hypothetical protein TNCV_2155581 [Trichonephila clavipes]|nr:hypothetical protein TNCV_2155581 [Trichonephila clavipes]
MLAIGLHVLPGQESTETEVKRTGDEQHGVKRTGDEQHGVMTLANIRQIISVERFQTLVESMPRRVVAIIKARRGPTCYYAGIPNLVAL